MARATHVLVLANRTADSDALSAALRDRADGGPAAFTLIVPRATSAAPERLAAALDRLRAEGLAVDGRLADPDPMLAVADAYDPAVHDEIMVATLPTGPSRWLQADLPHRIQRHTGAAVHHVVVGEPRHRPALTPVEEHHAAHDIPSMASVGSLLAARRRSPAGAQIASPTEGAAPR